jgi:hypothetical protein
LKSLADVFAKYPHCHAITVHFNKKNQGDLSVCGQGNAPTFLVRSKKAKDKWQL